MQCVLHILIVKSKENCSGGQREEWCKRGFDLCFGLLWFLGKDCSIKRRAPWHPKPVKTQFPIAIYLPLSAFSLTHVFVDHILVLIADVLHTLAIPLGHATLTLDLVSIEVNVRFVYVSQSLLHECVPFLVMLLRSTPILYLSTKKWCALNPQFLLRWFTCLHFLNVSW